MRKEEFFEKLEYLLQDVSDEEKEDALAYYLDYLEDAGPENEEQVIEEFGSPERVAAIIRADITGNLKDGGSFTEKGYEDERFRDPNYQVAKRLDLPDEREFADTQNSGYEGQQSNYYGNPGNRSGAQYQEVPYREYYAESNEKDPSARKTKKKGLNTTLKWILLAILLVVASPLILTVGGSIIGAVGIFIGILVSICVLTVVAFVASVIVAGLGVGFLWTAPLDSLFMFGIAVCGAGCGLLGVAILVVIFGMFLPFCLKGLWRGIQSLFARGKEAA